MKKILFRLFLLAVVAGAGYGVWKLFQQMPQRQEQVASAKVRKGDVVVRTFARGELRAVRSATLIAPNLFGTVQVTQLASLGALAKEKDLIVEFDDAEVQSRIEEKQLELDQIDEQIKKSQADLNIRNNQDLVELLRAKYAVRRSELEVKRNELLPVIDQRRNELNLEESRRRLKQYESDIQSRREQAVAEMAVQTEKKRKGAMEMSRERQRLSQVKLLAPMSGLIAIRQNRSGSFFPGMQIPDIREGDQVQPGMAIADVLDLSELEVVAKIGELDRANLKDGQDVLIRLDAVGDKTFHGRIKSMSGTASANIFSGDPAKKFDVVFSIDMKELLSGLGAKPEQINRILAQAEANRKRPPIPTFGGGAAMMMAGGMGAMGGGGGMMMAGGPGGGGAPGGGAPGGGAPGMAAMGGGQTGGGQAGGGGRAFGGGAPSGAGASGAASMSDEDRQKMRAAFQKALNGRNMQDLSAEERTKLMEEVRKAVPGGAPAGGTRAAGAAAGGAGRPAAAGAPGATPATGDAQAAGGERAARRARGEGGAEGAGGGRRGGGDAAAGGAGGLGGMSGGFGGGMGAGGFSEKDLANAKLPPPVDPDNQLEVLLRPGLLADVEIILERIPDAINIPSQAVFEKDGKQIVYVLKGKTWEERVVKPLKRSDSVMVLSSGVQPGETIALADPNAKPGDKKKNADKPAGGSAVGGLPGGRS